MSEPKYDHPALQPRHVRNAKLLSNRHELIRSLGRFKGGIVAEVGVATGDFSTFLIETLDPSKFIAIDTFKIHRWPTLWGRNTREIFGGLTHRQYYERRLTRIAPSIRIDEGLSFEALDLYPDKYFDVIYIDADHGYDSVKRDAEVSDRKIKDEGVIVFNDYIMYDHLTGRPYGVVQAANEFIVANNYEVEAFALAKNMFCDVAIRKMR